MSQIHLSENSQIKTTEDSNVYRGELVFDEYSQDLGVATRDNINEPLYYAIGCRRDGNDEIKKLLTNYKSTELDFSVDSQNPVPVYLNKETKTPLLIKENGSTFFNSDSIKGWSNLKSVTSNQIGIFGLKENGKIIYSSSCINFNQDWVQKFLKENEFEKILASSNQIAGLTKDGILRCIYIETTTINNSNLVFFQHKFNPEESSHNLYNGIWNDEDIIDFKMGFRYIIGIKSNKTIKVLGYLNDYNYNKNILNMENGGFLLLEDTEVNNWIDVDKLAAHHDGLISLHDGKVNNIYLALHVYNRDKIMDVVKQWDNLIDIAICERGINDTSSLPDSAAYMVSITIIGVKADGTCVSSTSLNPYETDKEVKTFTNVIEASSSYVGIYLKRSKPVRTTYDMFKEQIKERLMGYSPEDADLNSKIFGIRVDMNNADPDAACTYTDACYNMQPMWVDGIYNENLHQGSWTDELIQKLMGCRPCIVEWTPSDDNNAQDTHVLGYLDPNDYTKWIDGRPNGIINSDGSMGALTCTDNEFKNIYYNKSIMIEFDELYVYNRYDKTNKVLYLKISKTKYNDDWESFSASAGASYDPNRKDRTKFYISAYPLYYRDCTGIAGCTGIRAYSYPDGCSTIVNAGKNNRLKALREYTEYNGYKSNSLFTDQHHGNDNGKWKTMNFYVYSFLHKILSIFFKTYNLQSTKLFYIPVENNSSFGKELLVSELGGQSDVIPNCVNTGLYTYNKGLFWKGYASKGYITGKGSKWNEGYHFNTNYSTNKYTDNNYKLAGLKILGIDGIFFSLHTFIDDCYINATLYDANWYNITQCRVESLRGGIEIHKFTNNAASQMTTIPPTQSFDAHATQPSGVVARIAEYLPSLVGPKIENYGNAYSITMFDFDSALKNSNANLYPTSTSVHLKYFFNANSNSMYSDGYCALTFKNRLSYNALDFKDIDLDFFANFIMQYSVCRI